MVNHARKKGNDVECKTCMSMIWVKDSRLRGMLEKKCYEKMSSEMPKIMKKMEDRLRDVVAGQRVKRGKSGVGVSPVEGEYTPNSPEKEGESAKV